MLQNCLKRPQTFEYFCFSIDNNVFIQTLTRLAVRVCDYVCVYVLDARIDCSLLQLSLPFSPCFSHTLLFHFARPLATFLKLKKNFDALLLQRSNFAAACHASFSASTCPCPTRRSINISAINSTIPPPTGKHLSPRSLPCCICADNSSD